MEATVDLGGVRTWYEVDGAGEPLVHLHGGFSESDEPDPLRARFRVSTPDRRGPGRTPDAEGPIDFDGTTTDTIAFLEDVIGGLAGPVGFSDGATTALHVALRRPDLVRRMEKPELVARLVLDFLTTEPVPTRAPIRRR